MSLGIPEINEHAVAHVFCDEASEAAYSVSDAPLIGQNELAQVLWVHAGRERRRTDKVGQHHRDRAPLGLIRSLSFWRHRGLRGRSRTLELGNRRQHLSPMAKRRSEEHTSELQSH